MDKSSTKKNEKEVSEIKKLNEELNLAKKQIEEYKNKYLRALADYQNQEKRTKEEKDELIKFANTGLIIKLLPFLDNLDKAEIFIKDPNLKIIKDNFHKLLTELGVKEISVLGKEFDPNFAEAIEIIQGDKDNVIKEVVKKGYEYNGKIIRIAQVKVSKKLIKN